MEEVKSVAEGCLSEGDAHYLRTVCDARLHQSMGGGGQWMPEWRREREEEALRALKAPRRDKEGPSHGSCPGEP